MASLAARRSLRTELLAVLLAAVVVTWLATAVVGYFDARHEVDELLDAHLAQSASLLVAQAGRDDDEIEIEHAPQVHRYARRVAFQFWEKGSLLRLHSANAPNVRLSAKDDGFSDATIEGTRWRVWSGWDAERRYLIQVGERLDARDEIIATIARNLLWPLLVALPALALLIWFGIDRAVRPLRRLNREVAQRAPDNLAPLDLGRAPAEVAPLAESLNRLFERVRASIDNERRFTADAAHELRTPLAAVRAQAQVARGPGEDGERHRALDQVVAGCDRASHLVDQLLTLARLEPESFRAQRERCDLGELARVVAGEIAPSALAKSIDVELESDPHVEIAADAHLVRILLRNLVDNAVRYSPGGTVVRVRVAVRDRVAVLIVADEGPGVEAAERPGLGQRFHRLLGNDASGSGLGLSIVRRIAELHGATVDFSETAPGGGLTVSVSFTLSR